MLIVAHRPVWRVEDTGVAKALERIRSNWKEIRAEGRDLMELAKVWKEDPGFNSIPGAQGWWEEIFRCEFSFSEGGARWQ